jgi:4'-phosphopantetheinyl transferase
VRVWCVPLRCNASAERRLLALLDPGEAARAARFASPDLRHRFVVSHGVLRLLLSTFTGRDPRAIRFDAGARGKPFVAGGPYFSLSHGDAIALVAVTTGGPVGVDVERIRPDVKLDAVARTLLTAPDAARIDALPPERRERAWFQAWTRLEAVAKASGEGLRDDAAADPREPAPFRVWDLDVDAAHVGAIAAGSWAAQVIYEALPDVPSA